MRVTFILNSFPRLPIGGYRVVYEHSNHLASRGHDVSVVHCRHVGELPGGRGLYGRLRTRLGYVYRSIAKPSPRWQSIDPKVRLVFVPEPLERHVPDGDAVFATSWALSDYVLGYGPEKGKKCYLFQHYETWSGPKDKVDSTWKAPFRKVVISKWLLGIGKTLGAVDMTYIPNGIDHERFRIKTPVEDRGKVVSMMFSRQGWKGSADGLRALEIAKGLVPEMKAVIFGVESPGFRLPEWMEFHRDPAQEFLASGIYNRSSCFLWPSLFEGFSLPPAEAMACGCAAVTTDCGGIRDFAQHMVSALISEPGRPDRLAENLVRCLREDGLRRRLSVEGVRSVGKLTWKRSAGLMEKFLSGEATNA